MRRRIIFASIAIVALILVSVFWGRHHVPTLALGRADTTPTRVRIDRLGIDLSVQTGKYNTSSRQWDIDESNAFFAATSQEPNTRAGGTLVYAHNREALFGRTIELQPGDIVTLETQSGETYEYAVHAKEDVNPSDTNILHYRGKPMLTLLTCSGENDSTRRLTHAHLLRSYTNSTLAQR